ncbi:helix-turn-helix transcriptional regulator, partial [Bacillus sp. S34]|nr:helix-turn-helix transcriptional regulator [Bacillus sp. S34]
MAPEARVLDLPSMKALNHPLRTELFNELAAHGPATATTLAERVGESTGSTSYHLRQLEKHGFIEEVEGCITRLRVEGLGGRDLGCDLVDEHD